MWVYCSILGFKLNRIDALPQKNIVKSESSQSEHGSWETASLSWCMGFVSAVVMRRHQLPRSSRRMSNAWTQPRTYSAVTPLNTAWMKQTSATDCELNENVVSCSAGILWLAKVPGTSMPRLIVSDCFMLSPLKWRRQTGIKHWEQFINVLRIMITQLTAVLMYT